MSGNNESEKLLLVGESFSPWTKKARWALERCQLEYAYQEYTPTLSEPLLRWRMRQYSGKVSVPVLFAAGRVIRGSWDIACYANSQSPGKRLGDMAAITAWDALSEAALAEGRTRVVRAVLDSETALEESLPAFIPNSLRKPLRFLARDAASRLDRKYAELLKPGSIHTALSAIREGLKNSNSDFLQGKFSYADITMAAVVEVIAPIARTEPELGPATTVCWHDVVLAKEFEDIVTWRDRLAANTETNFSQFQAND